MTPAQKTRIAELEVGLRAEHGDAVTRKGSRVVVKGSKIAARVEPDGGAWLTWADGTRTYDHPRTDNQEV